MMVVHPLHADIGSITEIRGVGQVLRDKYIRVTEFIVDQKPFDPNRIAQMFTLLTEHNETVYSSYWGFNGTVELDMPYKSSLEYHLSNLI